MTQCIIFMTTVLGVALLGQYTVTAYPDGAPEETCDSMRPGHHTTQDDPSSALIEPQTGQPFYSISVDKRVVSPNESVLVTITANEYYYEGFILQARDVTEQTSNSSSKKKYGTFSALDNSTKTLCNNQAITHAVHEHFNSTTVRWTAPSEKVQNIQFKATVVKGYKTFFMNVYSEPVNFSDAITLVPSFVLMAALLCFNICRTTV